MDEKELFEINEEQKKKIIYMITKLHQILTKIMIKKKLRIKK